MSARSDELSTETKAKYALIGKAIDSMDIKDYVVFRGNGCTIMRDVDTMTAKEKSKLIEAIIWEEAP